MKLPLFDRAIVDSRKLTGYLLSTAHPIGRFKAGFFERIGFDGSKAEELRNELLHLARRDVDSWQDSSFGRKYLIRGILTGPSGKTARVVVVWIVRQGEQLPRLVTVVPEK